MKIRDHQTLPDWFKFTADGKFNTPDASDLGQMTHIPVFVFDCFKRGFSCNNLLFGNLIGRGLTARPAYQVFIEKKAEHREVVAFETNAGQNGHCIFGEVFVVPREHVFDLDLYQSNTHVRRRQYIFVRIKDIQGDEWFYTRAWMWLGIPDRWKKEFENNELEPLELMKPKFASLQSYYLLKPEHEKNNNHEKRSKMSNM